MQDTADRIVSERARVAVPAVGQALCRPLATLGGEVGAIVLIVPLLLALALWNGFPFIFYDTGAYVLEGLGHVFLAERSPVYSLFLDYTDASTSLWFVVSIQSLIVAFTIVETLRAVAPGTSLAWAVGIGLALVSLTSLPWFVGEIEPDCFTGTTVLSLYLLVFRREAVAGWREDALLCGVVLSMAAHPSHLLLGLGLSVLTVGYWALRRLLHAKDWPRAAILRPLMGCTFSVLLVVAANYDLTGKIFISRSGPAFLFARLLQDGIVMRLLDDTCAEAHYRLCYYKDDLPRTADQWLWNTSSPFFAMNKFTGTSAESTRIIWDSIWRYPFMHVVAATNDTLRQFAMFRTGDQIEPQEWVLSPSLKRFLPSQMESYLTARQQRGEIDFRPINIVHVGVAWLSLAGLTEALVFMVRTRRRDIGAFLAFVLIALIGNAVVCGTLSNPHNRYQSRLIWLAPFALAALAGDRARFALRGVAESGS
ncbi:MAG TPA: hypothetical protein VN154_02715 [Rhizomicrobium sp.]|nr:hypothetical protein [Rhizomicrobium sp.]